MPTTAANNIQTNKVKVITKSNQYNKEIKNMLKLFS